MTRINIGVPPCELHAKHLIAEHREIIRVPNCIVKGKYNLKNQTNEFKLGTGHVKFFYTRLGYLKKRYDEIYNECIKRGFKVRYYGDSWDNVPQELMNDYTPTIADIAIIKERIQERLATMKK